jgi:hypothetical protein
MSNYFLVVGDVSINSDMFLVIDFVNLKKVGSFECVHIGMMYMCIFISVYKYLCLYYISKHPWSMHDSVRGYKLMCHFTTCLPWQVCQFTLKTLFSGARSSHLAPRFGCLWSCR